ncbi:MAG: MFS transporter [Planctomycetaceae bacterium]|nr:MFS transporter [Planctomycetaceae bacterium]
MTKSYLRYALAVIFFANFLSYLDRQVVSALEHQLKHAFHLNTREFGYVGSAFTVGYMVFAPIVGFLIARHRRPRIFALCVIVWSIATICSGIAPNKYTLYATRFSIGAGEAGCLVIGPTLLSDYFPQEVRGRILSLFFLALPLGGATGYIAGAQINELWGWKAAFYIAGAPGFLVAALIWNLIDPTPSGVPADPHHPQVKGIRPYFDLLRNRTLLFIILAQAFAVIFLQPFLHFGVGFFEEERHLTKKAATLGLASLALIAGALGNALSGFIGDRLAKTRKGAYALLAAVAFLTGLPFMVAGFTLEQRALFFPALGFGAFCYFLCMPAVNTQIANSVAPEKRAMAYALAVFILHCLGDTAALPIFGQVSDMVGGKKTAFTIFSFALLLASVSCLLAYRFAGDEERPRPETAKAGPA